MHRSARAAGSSVIETSKNAGVRRPAGLECTPARELVAADADGVGGIAGKPERVRDTGAEDGRSVANGDDAVDGRGCGSRSRIASSDCASSQKRTGMA